MISWALFYIHQSIKQGMCSFFMMISHATPRLSFSGTNMKSFNISKISRPLLRHILEVRSKSFKHIMGGSMSTIRYIIFFLRMRFNCSTQFPILRSKTKLLSERIDPWKRWHLACCMQSHFHKDYGLKNLIV
jgi:hypothetical protein